MRSLSPQISASAVGVGNCASSVHVHVGPSQITQGAGARRRKRTVAFLIFVIICWAGWSVFYVASFRDGNEGASASIQRYMHRRHVAAQREGVGPDSITAGGNSSDTGGGESSGSPLTKSGSSSDGGDGKESSEGFVEAAAKAQRKALLARQQQQQQQLQQASQRAGSNVLGGGSGAQADDDVQRYATIHTDYGPIHWELHHADAPRTVRNIIRMARVGVFNDSCFYRYERGFVLQGGLHCNKRRSHTKGATTVPLEYKRPNAKLTVALARAGSILDSGGTEFFINLADNSKGLGPGKKGGYAVFATVVGTDSIDTMHRLKQLRTVKKGLTVFVDPQPIIYYIAISDFPPATV